MFTFEFVTDDEITVKYYHNKEWKYFNTICLVQHCGAKSVDDLQSSMDLVANHSGSESFLDSLSRIP